ncbi:MAG: ABC transporter permease [Saprospiraceae bacterium]|nr:ABC transporter permease [Saprospiraceae bacterium]
MFRSFRISAGIAFQTLRANVFHTMLSTLGMVIGVAALVSILALGDGMEKFGREQVSGTTNFQTIVASPLTRQEIDGVWIAKDHPPVLTESDLSSLNQAMSGRAKLMLQTNLSGMMTLQGDTLRKPALVVAFAGDLTIKEAKLAHGRLFSPEELAQKEAVIILSDFLAKKLSGAKNTERLLSRKIVFNNKTMRVVGILAADEKDETPRAAMPMHMLDSTELHAKPPQLMVTASHVEEVPALKTTMEQYFDARVAGGKAGFEIITNEARVEQISEGILLFKIVMGLITGIAILVGGIGVMNVLLMSVTERTREIGIRKASGANRRDISLQFLTEALAISLTGSLAGFVLGMALTLGVTPIIRSLTKIPFYAAFDYRSLVVVVIVAILVGIIFGVYPARKAARLTPVEAIRHE